jgi:hypothetical protein
MAVWGLGPGRPTKRLDKPRLPSTQARADLQPERMVVVTPSPTWYALADGVEVMGLAELAGQLLQAG